MRLYHTGHHELRDPDIHIGRKNADFGQGFYLSPDDAFAGKWVREQKEQEAFVNAYELETEGLRVRRLKRDGEWFRYLSRNRAGLPDLWWEDDVIIGPIANDTIYNTLGIFTSGLLPEEQMLALLQIGPAFEQIVIKTDRARRNLRWLSSRVLSHEEIAGLRRVLVEEEEAYQTALAMAFAGMEDEGDGHKTESIV